MSRPDWGNVRALLNSEHGKRENPIRRLRGLWARGRGFRAADRGGVALLTALALPPILLVSMGAIQLQSVFSDKNKSQNVADAAALWGAQQLTVTPVGVSDRAKAFAEAQLGEMAANAEVTVTATVLDATTMKVAVDTYRPSFFFNLMPFGGFYTHAESVAEGVSQTPLCVITFGTESGHKMEVTGDSKMRAPACLIHANERIEVGGAALLQADTIETGASASGPMSPAASTGAPDVDDPFADLDISGGGAVNCLLQGLLEAIFNTSGTLAAGCHSKVEVKEGQTLTLASGVHYFKDDFILKNNARLVGDDVVLIFGPSGEAKWKDGASVNLTGRQSGGLAGFVMVTARNRQNEFKLESDSIDTMTGTIYVPNATLNIDGDGQSAQASDWTVMAVERLKLSNKPQVQINANYSGSDVPVPSGVGNKSKADFTHLKQ